MVPNQRWSVCPQSLHCDGRTKFRLQIRRGQIPCKYPAHQILSISATTALRVFLIWQPGSWQQIWNKFRTWRHFLLYLKKKVEAEQALSRWLIIQRWRHFPRPCWIYNQPALNWLSEDIWKLRWTSWENSICSSKYFCHHYWYWQRCHVFRSLTLFLYQSCQSFSIEKHLISKSQTAVSWKV